MANCVLLSEINHSPGIVFRLSDRHYAILNLRIFSLDSFVSFRCAQCVVCARIGARERHGGAADAGARGGRRPRRQRDAQLPRGSLSVPRRAARRAHGLPAALRPARAPPARRAWPLVRT